MLMEFWKRKVCYGFEYFSFTTIIRTRTYNHAYMVANK